jgi:hypothetical protein
MRIKNRNIDYIRILQRLESMSREDPGPLPYGPLQYYQLHFIMEMQNKDNGRFLARCKPVTRGYLQNKRIIDVKWKGQENFVEVLEADTVHNDMLKEIIMEIGEITIDPQDDHIRIYSMWIHEANLPFDPIMLEIADRIALHIKDIAHEKA